MQDNDLAGVFSFVNESREESLSPRPAAAKRNPRWLPWVIAFLFSGAASGAVIALLVSQGYILLPTHPPAVPAQAPVAKLEQPPVKLTTQPTGPPLPPPQAAPRPPVEPTEVAVAKPNKPAKPRVSAKKDVPPVVLAKTPDQVLEAKGLKSDGEVWHLVAKEYEAGRLCLKNKEEFTRLADLNSVLSEIDIRRYMVRYLENVREINKFNNADLNTYLASIPKRCGPRENSLNSVQLQAHFQVLNNAQDINDLNRLIYYIKEELRDFNQNKLQGEFDKLLPTCQKSLVAAEKAMNATIAEYKQLQNDESVNAALTKTGGWVGQSRDFGQAVAFLQKERFMIMPQNNR